ncbi:hypothetical protein BDU57DRAFT_511411 [Ampelomyces quisqualis]|uniref:Myb-like domain-containing protein n=1 Tax=Ampelomyces quisqualis TaxID=50730 RepID=A0A6A5QV49_AMPQU|nr:hypothetical protein BDU57DRAFT_511411 [Ampelomyces quisqualis]
MSPDIAIPIATDNGCHSTEKQDQDLLYMRTNNPRGSWKSIAGEVGMTGAPCMKRFQVIRPKASTSKVTSEETEDPEPTITEAEKKAGNTAKRVEGAQQNLKVQLQPGVNTGRSMTTPELFLTEDDAASFNLGSLEDEDVVLPPTQATAEDSEESKVGYNWTDEADQELVRLRRSKRKSSWPKIAKKLNAPIDLCKERFQLIKLRGSANKASKEERKARKAKKPSKVRWYDMREGISEPEFDFELQSDADIACSVTPKSHHWGDDYDRTKILDQEAEQVGFGGGDDTGGFYGTWANRADPNKRSACVENGGWDSAPRSDTEGDGWNRAAPVSGPSSDDGRPVDAWSSCGSGSICNPPSMKNGDSTRKKKIEPAAVAPKPYEITYWATVECGDQIVHIPIDSSNVAGPEKIILDGPAKKVWKWVQEKGLSDKIGLQDAFDLAKDIYGVDAVEEETDDSDTPQSASRSSDVWNTICVACGRDATRCECGLGRTRCSKDKDGFYWDA